MGGSRARDEIAKGLTLPQCLSRRAALGTLLAVPTLQALQQQGEKDWSCPMDSDVRSAQPGKCPRCGMPLSLNVPDRVEYPIEITHSPKRLNGGDTVTLTLRIINPATGKGVTQFDIVHEKLIHLFVVSQNLEFFAHIHPEPQKDGTFKQQVRLPFGGAYRLLADFYPSGSVPQLALSTVIVSGAPPPASLSAQLAPVRAENMSAALKVEPEVPLAGLESRLTFAFDPATGLQPYLGAWGHMLVASSDLIDLLHIHPFLGDSRTPLQFNVIFPRPGAYRIWTQFQREGVVNTTRFTIPVKAF